MSQGEPFDRWQELAREARNRSHVIWDSVSALDHKATVAAATSSAVLAALATGYTIVQRIEGTDFSPGFFSLLLMIIGGLAYVAALTFALWAHLVRGWSAKPELVTFLNHVESSEYTDAQIQQWVSKEYIESVSTNIGQLRKKALLVNISTCALAVETLTLSGGLLLTVL